MRNWLLNEENKYILREKFSGKESEIKDLIKVFQEFQAKDYDEKESDSTRRDRNISEEKRNKVNVTQEAGQQFFSRCVSSLTDCLYTIRIRNCGQDTTTQTGSGIAPQISSGVSTTTGFFRCLSRFSCSHNPNIVSWSPPRIFDDFSCERISNFSLNDCPDLRSTRDCEEGVICLIVLALVGLACSSCCCLIKAFTIRNSNDSTLLYSIKLCVALLIAAGTVTTTAMRFTRELTDDLQELLPNTTRSIAKGLDFLIFLACGATLFCLLNYCMAHIENDNSHDLENQTYERLYSNSDLRSDLTHNLPNYLKKAIARFDKILVNGYLKLLEEQNCSTSSQLGQLGGLTC